MPLSLNSHFAFTKTLPMPDPLVAKSYWNPFRLSMFVVSWYEPAG